MANVAVDASSASGGITRREFLYYIWGASMVLLTAQATGLLVWFLIPRFREGEFGGSFLKMLSDVPDVNAPPANFADGRFWLVNLDSSQPNANMYLAQDESEQIVGIAAIYKVCTHLGCIYTWTASNNRFECPCHGSKYRLDGRRIEAPAPRDLDRFKVYAVAEDKTTVLNESPLVNNSYAPMTVPADTVYIRIDTGDRKLGLSSQLLCDFTNSCP
jgi:cytochrome b6-f complex iron-sulfur subunit